MSGSLEDIYDLKCRPEMWALLPVDVYAGLPLELDDNTVFIPYFELRGPGSCALYATLIMAISSKEILEYKRHRPARPFPYDSLSMQKAKRAYFDRPADRGFIEYMPKEMREIYWKAEEGWFYDKDTNSF